MCAEFISVELDESCVLMLLVHLEDVSHPRDVAATISLSKCKGIWCKVMTSCRPQVLHYVNTTY